MDKKKLNIDKEKLKRDKWERNQLKKLIKKNPRDGLKSYQ